MDRNTVHLYETLGVPKSSTQEEIKKAYRRLALRYHPDKVNVSEVPDHETRFRDIAAAYEVLGDPKKRQVYDRHGLIGVQMAGTEIGARILEIESLLCSIFVGLSFLFTLVIIFFVFLSLRVDGKVSWDYAVVFIPLWIVDAFLFFTALGRLFGSDAKEDDYDHFEDNDSDHESRHSARSTTGLADRDNRERQKKAAKKRDRILGASVTLINLILFTAFQVLIVKKANDPTSVSGTTVFAPFFASECFYILLALVQIPSMWRMASAVETPLSIKLTLVLEVLWWKLLRVAQAVLIMLRIDDIITCSWQIVFIPLYLVFVKYFIQLLLGYRTISRTQNPILRQQGQAVLTASACTLTILGSLLYSLVGLLAAKLDGYSYSASRVLIPVFITLSILLCCSGCCLPCLLLASNLGSDNEEAGAETAQVRVVHPNLRIEDGNSPSSSSRGATSSS